MIFRDDSGFLVTFNSLRNSSVVYMEVDMSYEAYYLLSGHLSTQLDTHTTVQNIPETSDSGGGEPFVRATTTHGTLDFEPFYESSSYVIKRVEITVGDCIDVYLEREGELE